MIDYVRLAESNSLSTKWATKCGIPKNKFMQFVQNIRNDPKAFANTLTVRDKKEFLADLPSMFYVAEFENELVLKFKPAVFHMLKKFRVKDTNWHDELISLGFTAIRSALWRYSRPHIKLSTFVFNGIICCFRGELSRLHYDVRPKKIRNLSSCRQKHFELEAVDHRASESSLLLEAEEIQSVLAGNGFTNEEREILDYYTSKNCHHGVNWVTLYRNARAARSEHVHHRSQILKKLYAIRKKLALVLYQTDHERYGRLYRKVRQLKTG